MSDVSSVLRQIRDDESGQDMVEYVLIVVFIAMAITVALLSYQGSLSDVFTNASNTMQDENPF